MRLVQVNYRAESLPLWSRKETQQKGEMNGGMGTTAWKEIFFKWKYNIPKLLYLVYLEVNSTVTMSFTMIYLGKAK